VAGARGNDAAPQGSIRTRRPTRLRQVGRTLVHTALPKALRTLAGAAGDTQFLDAMSRELGPFDIIIDDGSHMSHHIIASFNALFPHVRPGGIYVVEDLATAYWPTWGGDPDPSARSPCSRTWWTACTTTSRSATARTSRPPPNKALRSGSRPSITPRPTPTPDGVTASRTRVSRTPPPHRRFEPPYRDVRNADPRFASDDKLWTIHTLGSK